MNAKSLNDKIEQLAKDKATNHVHQMKKAIEDACGKTCVLTGNKGERLGFVKNTFLEVMKVYLKDNSQYNYPWHAQELVDHYRTQILDEILTKLPLIKELNELVD